MVLAALICLAAGIALSARYHGAVLVPASLAAVILAFGVAHVEHISGIKLAVVLISLPALLQIGYCSGWWVLHTLKVSGHFHPRQMQG